MDTCPHKPWEHSPSVELYPVESLPEPPGSPSMVWAQSHAFATKNKGLLGQEVCMVRCPCARLSGTCGSTVMADCVLHGDANPSSLQPLLAALCCAPTL